MNYLDMNNQELKQIYSRYFSTGYLQTDLISKFALVSLICFLTKSALKSNSEATCYKVIKKILAEDTLIDQDFIRGLSIICDDILINNKDFPTFDFTTSAQMVNKIKEILSCWVPF